MYIRATIPIPFDLMPLQHGVSPSILQSTHAKPSKQPRQHSPCSDTESQTSDRAAQDQDRGKAARDLTRWINLTISVCQSCLVQSCTTHDHLPTPCSHVLRTSFGTRLLCGVLLRIVNVRLVSIHWLTWSQRGSMFECFLDLIRHDGFRCWSRTDSKPPCKAQVTLDID